MRRRARLRQGDEAEETVGVFGLGTVEADDDVERPHTGSLRGEASIHAPDDRPGGVVIPVPAGDVWIDEIDAAAKRTPVDHAVLDELAHDLLREVRRNGEADAFVPAGPRVDHAVDADELAARVDQRPAGVAGVDGRVSLNEVRDAAALCPSDGRDDAERHRAAQLERVANRQNPLRNPELARIAPG